MLDGGIVNKLKGLGKYLMKDFIDYSDSVGDKFSKGMEITTGVNPQDTSVVSNIIDTITGLVGDIGPLIIIIGVLLIMVGFRRLGTKITSLTIVSYFLLRVVSAYV